MTKMIFGCKFGKTILQIVIILFKLRLLSSFARESICTRISGLSHKQTQMCIESPDAILTLANGFRLSADECQHQFSGHRWNCSEVWKQNILGHMIPLGSREAAVVYALSSAAGVYSLALACSKGNISICGCHRHQNVYHDQSWKWGGCSVDVDFAMQFTRKFLNAREIDKDGRTKMNLHNNNVGRKIVAKLLKKDCLCHGVSGSCQLKTCWKTLPQYREIGDILYKKYERAKMVVEKVADNGAITLNLKRKPRTGIDKIKRMELIFLENSPNYCEKNFLVGSSGTHGRRCERTAKNSSQKGSCHLLCCGRGYTTKIINNNWQCHCKFEWAEMAVKCEICRNPIEEYFCK